MFFTQPVAIYLILVLLRCSVSKRVEKSEVIDRTSSLYIGDGMSGNGNKCASAARELLQAPSNCTAFQVAPSKQVSQEGLSMEIFYNSTINQPNKSRLCSCNFLPHV